MTETPSPAMDYLQTIRKHQKDLARRFTVRRIGLFGSITRGTAGPESDVDVLVELSEPTFDHYMDLKFFLENMFGRPVDLVLHDTIKQRLKDVIDKEIIYA